MSFADQLKRIFGVEPESTGLLQVHEPLDLAIAALLVELARADFSESETEFAAIRQLLGRRFGIGETAVNELIARAIQRADRAVSLHEFTHRLNTELRDADKLAIVEMLWQVSHADGYIDKHEEHLIRRIAGLLHVSDRDRIRLKLKTIVPE
ncbi:MAG TPA: TerB family tellurite resistance protein [Povalibacter sp.]|nr:TerB family tellurite resistance protein [Povalibacter sp.]